MNALRRVGRVLVWLFALLVALYSLRYAAVLFGMWPPMDAGIRGVISRAPVQALAHMVIAPIALLVGPLQFIPALRARYPQLHRYTGRLYVLCCLVAGCAALALAPYASGGPIAGFGFGLLALCWLGATVGGWQAAVQRRFERHRLLMRLSYAMTFGAVTLRLQIPLGFVLGYHSYPAMSVWLAYTSWIPNVIAVLIYSRLQQRGRATAAPRSQGDAKGALSELLARSSSGIT